MWSRSYIGKDQYFSLVSFCSFCYVAVMLLLCQKVHTANITLCRDVYVVKSLV